MLILVFNARIPKAGALLLKTTLSEAAFFAATAVYRLVKLVPVRWLIRTASVQLLLAQIFLLSGPMQLMLVRNWQDPCLLDFEQALFGVQPTLWLERFITPALTQWMMFCYVFYVPVYPILSLLIYRRHGEDQNEDYLFFIGLAIVLCTLGFMIFPVAGPMRHIGELHTVPLRGYFFTAVSELIRGRVHTPGGTIPSIHCAAATIMWWTAYRYYRPAFYVLAPVILSLYVSTVYGRFHYVFDVLAGIAAAFLTMALGLVLIRAWNRSKLRC